MQKHGDSGLQISAIAVCPSEAAPHDRAADLARRLAIPLAPCESEEYPFQLFYTAEGLALKQTGKNNPGPVMVNFTSPAMLYRIKHGGGRRQALARAVGLKRGWHPAIVDATAGLGRDGFILASLGCHVLLLERSPILAALLEDGLQRAQQVELTADIVKHRLRFTLTDSRDYLQKLKAEEYPDVIYLDPMYPERSKSSLVKKEMRILRGVAGSDADGAELLTIGLRRVRNRVVVKRPRLAPVLGRMQPSHQISGKSSRFDIYLARGQNMKHPENTDFPDGD